MTNSPMPATRLALPGMRLWGLAPDRPWCHCGRAKRSHNPSAAVGAGNFCAIASAECMPSLSEGLPRALSNPDYRAFRRQRSIMLSAAAMEHGQKRRSRAPMVVLANLGGHQWARDPLKLTHSPRTNALDKRTGVPYTTNRCSYRSRPRWWEARGRFDDLNLAAPVGDGGGFS